MSLKQSDRLIQLNESTRSQMQHYKITKIEMLQQQVNEDNKFLIENK